MKPKDGGKIRPPTRRAALRLGVDARSGSTIVSPSGSHWFSDRKALLRFLTDPNTPRSFTEVWLTPFSPGDWSGVALLLAEAGWTIGVSRRHGQIASVFCYKPGAVVGGAASDVDAEGGEEPAGRIWAGRSAAGLAHVPAGLSPADECRATLDQIDAIDHAIRERFPSVSLGSSLTGTGTAIFRTMLREETGCDPQIEVSLRRGGAVGGGRQEMFVPPGSVYHARETVNETTGEVSVVGGACDLDIASAYPTALETAPIGARLLGLGGPSSYADPCTCSLALVEVPSALAAGPLRYAPTDGSASCYPVGLVLGTWSHLQLRAAELLGCKIREVHTTWRFAPDPAFARFGESMRAWRKELGRDVVGSACKQIAVRTVGAWLMAPRENEIWVGAPPPDRMKGARFLGRNLWELTLDVKQHPSSILPAGIFTIGAVQAWAALLLGRAKGHGVTPLYWHTDGGAFDDVTKTMALVKSVVAEGKEIAFPPFPHWRFNSFKRLQIWSPGQRLETLADGSSQAKGSVLSGEISPRDLIDRSRRAEAIAAMDLRSAGRRVWTDGVSRPPHLREVDRAVHDRLTRIARRDARPF